MQNKFDIYYDENNRYEKIGSQIVKHQLNYIDKKTEHPLFVKAREYYLNHEWKKAKRQYEKLLSINPNNATYHHSYACVLSRLHQGPNVRATMVLAQKHSAIALKLGPENVYNRMCNILFLLDLDAKYQIHQEFQIVFKQLLSTPDISDIDTSKLSKNERLVLDVSLEINIVHLALATYSTFLFNLSEYEDAIKYLEKACIIKRKFQKQLGDIEQRTRCHLSLYYLQTENVEKAKYFISLMEQINEKSIWETFQSVRRNNDKPWGHCKAVLYLLIGNYQEAYSLLKYELAQFRQENQTYCHLLLYEELIECCIELGKYNEATSLDRELVKIYRTNPSLLKLPGNINIGWEREFMVAYCLIKKGGAHNAIKAVKYMECITKTVIQWNQHMGNRMPSAHFYLGLAYRNMCQYTDKDSQREYYFSKAKLAFFQAANYIPMRAKFVFQFAVILFECGELYLCKHYARKSWKRCSDIKCIATIYPKMKKKLKKRLKRIKCNYCGEQKYLKSKKPSDKLRVCVGCHRVYYCRKKCQKKHWKKWHRNKCSKIWIIWNRLLLKTVENFNQFIPFGKLVSDYSMTFKAIDQFCA